MKPPSPDVNETQVACIHEQSRGLTRNDDRVAPVEGIDQDDHSTDEGQAPERRRRTTLWRRRSDAIHQIRKRPAKQA
jgi:hypothetical protein